MDVPYQLWFAVRYAHVASIALLTGGAFMVSGLCISSGALPESGAGDVALGAAIIYQWMFWLVAGVTVATGVSNLGLKGEGLLGPHTNWGTALTVKLTDVFLLLWIATWWATRIGVRYAQSEDDTPATIVAAAVVGGGWNGVFVLAATLVFAGALLNPAVLIFSIIGGLIAFVVGGAVGFLYGLVDAALLGVSAALFDWATIDNGVDGDNG